MRCNAVLPMQIIIAAALQVFVPQHHPCTRAAALTVQMPAHCLQVTAQSTADDLTSLLCSLLCYTLTSLLCTSCSLLRSGTLEQPFLLGKLSASGSVIEYHFGITCDAARSLPPTTCAPADRPQHQRLAPHHPQHLPSCSATACGTSEWATFLGTTSARDFECECRV